MQSSEHDRHAYYGGRVHPSDSSTTFETYNPATGYKNCTIHTSTPETIDAAIKGAHHALGRWSLTDAATRAKILRRAAAILRARNDELALVETCDTGKPMGETTTVDVISGAEVLEYYALLIGESKALAAEKIPLNAAADLMTTKEPLGVCAAIGAWNYPMQIALWKSGPCIAAGNTLVYKPSEYTCLHAEYLADIYHEAGLPDGVFNVVYGGAEVGEALAKHRSVAKISFTGQVSTGRKVAAAAGQDLKYVTMELGGKNALVIMPDADMGRAADLAILANFYSSGQVCTSLSRVFVPVPLQQEFQEAVVARMHHVLAGPPQDQRTNFGPLSSEEHLRKVAGFVRWGVEEDGATVLYGGHRGDDPYKVPPADVPKALSGGYWLEPTIFTDCHDRMKIVREEIFGPVMCILSYRDEEEVIHRANQSTPFGLAATVCGTDENKCREIAQRLEAGILWINSWGESPAEMSVGGWKSSGLGVENGTRGLEAWLRTRSLLVRNAGSEIDTPFK